MAPPPAERITEWDTRAVPGGYAGLRELADERFSGAVTAGAARCYLLNGRIVGIAEGTLASFEAADLTAHEAPDPTLPLLFAMQARAGEPRARYYTDDNPLAEAHETLTEGGFTGYLELTDNVLSGDYYVVYYGGRSMSAAFVGNAGRLVTGDEAFRLAADEVGIYAVVDVDLDVRDVPAPAPEPPAEDPAMAAPEDATPSEPTVDGPTVDGPTADAPSDSAQRVPTPDPEPAADVEAPPADDGPVEAEPTVAEPAETATVESTESAPVEPAEPAAAEPEERPATHPVASTPPTRPADTAEFPPEPPAASEEGGARRMAPSPSSSNPPAESNAPGQEPARTGSDPFTEEVAWREARTIPALDPEESEAPPAAEDGGRQPAPEPRPTPTPDPSASDERFEELQQAIEAQSATIERLESRLESTSAEAERLREERGRLESQLATAGEASGGEPAPPGRSMDRETALDQTDLFVRYGTKGGGTLAKAHDGLLDREEVVGNLRIDHHTRFEEAGVQVGGRPFGTFLMESLEYRFVEWLVTEFLFEVQDTGSQRGLREVYDAIPLIDRVEFLGEVSWRDQEAGETVTESFDVVCRDRMGRALIVADLNDVRDPATGEMMAGLIEHATAIAEGVDSLSGAFMITSSFFQPDALSTAAEATGGGLLSRDRRWSFVKTNRRQGYHLCLVEARGNEFHVAVPEL